MKTEIKRLTSDNPQNSEFPNYLTLMNYCTAKNGRAVLRYADGKENVDLAEYVEKYCHNHGCSSGDGITSGKHSLPGGSTLLIGNDTSAAVGVESIGRSLEQRVGARA